jgi:hypothetical protein
MGSLEAVNPTVADGDVNPRSTPVRAGYSRDESVEDPGSARYKGGDRPQLSPSLVRKYNRS